MYPRYVLDFAQVSQQIDVDLDQAFAKLQQLYDDIDARNAANTVSLSLPCHRGCAMCCHESVFVTVLEFLFAWRYLQQKVHVQALADVVAQGLELYRKFEPTIVALNTWPEGDEAGRAQAARTLRFSCPMLDEAGTCRVYPARELLARLFGNSFNRARGVYGCHLVAEALGEKEVTLLQAEPTAARLKNLPLTAKRQVYPYYIHLFFAQS